MHAELTRQASEEEISLNAYVLALVARGLGDSAARAEAAQAMKSLLRDIRAEVAKGINVSARGAAANASPSTLETYGVPVSGAAQALGD
jgi:hypothetical protein